MAFATAAGKDDECAVVLADWAEEGKRTGHEPTGNGELQWGWVQARFRKRVTAWIIVSAGRVNNDELALFGVWLSSH